MYRVNPLLRNVLIMADEVIFHGPTKHTLDHRMIENSIIVAEERIIRPALGYDFYMALIDSKNKVVTDANKEELETQINESLPEGSDPVVLNNGDVVNSMEFLSADNKKLWTQHLWKLTAESVLMSAFPDGYVQFGSSGAIHEVAPAGPLNGASTVSPTLGSIKWMMDKKMQDRIDPLRESMHLWICKQKKADKNKYGLYEASCDCNSDGIAYKRKTDWITDIYDDNDVPNAY